MHSRIKRNVLQMNDLQEKCFHNSLSLLFKIHTYNLSISCSMYVDLSVLWFMLYVFLFEPSVVVCESWWLCLLCYSLFTAAYLLCEVTYTSFASCCD